MLDVLAVRDTLTGFNETGSHLNQVLLGSEKGREEGRSTLTVLLT